MNETSPSSLFDSNTPVGEVLLADTAIRIELPPSLHRLAVQRYEAVRNHIERADSPLFDRVNWFYPQGSMAIGATIKSRKRVDGYDIDIVAELGLRAGMLPAGVLELLFQAINGPKGSRYHGMVVKQTRCVTVYYEDGMHLDVTPSELLDANDPRRSHIFHAKAEEAQHHHKRIVTNSWGFCDWFNTNAPRNLQFEKAYAKRVNDRDFLSATLRADADVKPVPGHSTLEGGKSTSVVALQLLKRNRNIKYESRKGLRMPPSVMMAAITAGTRVPDASIGRTLEAIAQSLLTRLEDANAAGVLVDVRNPRCPEERFTDRWPENLAAQRIYIDDLKRFLGQLYQLMSRDTPLQIKRDLLVDMFGEGPAQSAVDDYSDALANSIRTGQRINAPSGRVLPVVSVVSSSIAVAAPTAPKHTFYGGYRRRR